MNELVKTDSRILTLDEKAFTKLLLYRDRIDDSKTNKRTMLAFDKFIYI